MPEPLSNAIEAFNWVVWVLFACELLVKTYLAPERGRYLRTHWIDVLIVALPFLRPIRPLSVILAGARLWTEARTVLRQGALGLGIRWSRS